MTKNAAPLIIERRAEQVVEKVKSPPEKIKSFQWSTVFNEKIRSFSNVFTKKVKSSQLMVKSCQWSKKIQNLSEGQKYSVREMNLSLSANYLFMTTRTEEVNSKKQNHEKN